MEWCKLECNHTTSEESQYLIFGYPEQKTKKNFPIKQILPESFLFGTCGFPHEYYLHKDIDIQKTIVLNANQKRVGRSSVMIIEELPILGGISSCGVWNVLNLFGENPQFKFVSILTGENDDKTVLYSSRIDNLKVLLEKQFNVQNFNSSKW